MSMFIYQYIYSICYWRWFSKHFPRLARAKGDRPWVLDPVDPLGPVGPEPAPGTTWEAMLDGLGIWNDDDWRNLRGYIIFVY